MKLLFLIVNRSDQQSNIGNGKLILANGQFAALLCERFTRAMAPDVEPTAIN